MTHLHTWEHQYLALLAHILELGEDRDDRTGVGTRAIFGAGIHVNLEEGFPLLTTKKMGIKTIASELLWFIEGSSDERRLAEILHGTRDPAKKTIWSPNAEGTTGTSYQPKFPGDLGRIYGVQWRDWRQSEVLSYEDYLTHDEFGVTYFGAKVRAKHIDQLAEVVHKLKHKPTDRRIILSAWNPGELDQMALPPCHMFAQFFVSNDKKLSCQMYQRSVDTFLGLPFNIASYSLLTMMLAKVCGLTPSRVSLLLGDTHIYSNHVDQVREQLNREPFAPPTLTLADRDNIDDFTMADFMLSNYQSHDAIKGDMAA